MGPVYPLCLSRRSASPDLPCRSMSSMSPATYPSDGAFSMSSGFRSRMVLSWSMHESRMILWLVRSSSARPESVCGWHRLFSDSLLPAVRAGSRFVPPTRPSYVRPKLVFSGRTSAGMPYRRIWRSALASACESACRTPQIRPYRLSKPRFLRLISEAFTFPPHLYDHGPMSRFQRPPVMLSSRQMYSRAFL